MVILGALIGVAAALSAQTFGSFLTRRREHGTAVRKLGARMLAHGRVVQMRIGNARVLHLQKPELVEQLSVPITPFVETAYELKWIAPEPLRTLAVTFQDSVQKLIEDWDAERDGMLDSSLAAAANALDDEVERMSAPRRRRRSRRSAEQAPVRFHHS